MFYTYHNHRVYCNECKGKPKGKGEPEYKRKMVWKNKGIDDEILQNNQMY